MSYKEQTIAKAISRLNVAYFLPAIQREFVWKQEQVVRLFDSILRGYPISSFLFWELKVENRAKWQAYRFLSEVHSDGSRNDLANTDGVADLHLILDGQQRLTSLNVGLRGFYTVRPKYARKNKESDLHLKLYLDLLHDPMVEEESEEGLYYGLKFRVDKSEATEGRYWYEVGRVLLLDTRKKLEEEVERIFDQLPESASKLDMRRVRHNLTRLFEAIHVDELISYFVEDTEDYDRVLDIFVRANSGATKLSKSDLLMSTVTGSWEGINARQEIHNFVDRLNSHLTRRNDFDTDFVMKSCLVLTDLPVQYKVANFNAINLTKIRTEWPAIKSAIERGADAINRFGIDRDTLTSNNALIPVLYFLVKRPGLNLQGTTPYEVKNRGIVRRWLLSVLLTGAFGGASDTALAQTRRVIESLPAEADFPSEGLSAALRSSGRSARPEDVIDAVMEMRYGRKQTFLALSLLYDEKFWGTINPHVDHIFPKALLSKTKIIEEAGLDPTEALILKDRIGNLCLLEDQENEEKNGRPFSDWMESRDASYLQKHTIPFSDSGWPLTQFPAFVADRERMIRDRVAALIGARVDGETIGRNEVSETPK